MSGMQNARRIYENGQIWSSEVGNPNDVTH